MIFIFYFSEKMDFLLFGDVKVKKPSEKGNAYIV